MTDIDVFLIAGQSNAVGQGLSASWSPVAAPGVLEWNARNGITAGNDPVGNATFSSAWPAFGNLYNASTGRNICFVPAAVGGTWQSSVGGSPNWDTTGTLYAASNILLGSALNALSTVGYNPIFKGILWCQGENDGASITIGTETQAQYKAALTTMIANYRGMYGTKMPFYIFRTGTNNLQSDAAYAQIRQAQEDVAASDPYTHIVFRGAYYYQTLHYQIQGQYNQMGYQGAQNVISSQGEYSGSPFLRQQANFGAQSGFTEQRTINLTNCDANWNTILTITPNEIINVYATGLIEVTMVGGTSGVGCGTRKSLWLFSISNGAPYVSIVTTDITTGCPPQFQIIVVGNNIILQVKVNSGANHLESGIANVKCIIPNAGSYSGFFEMYLS